MSACFKSFALWRARHEKALPCVPRQRWENSVCFDPLDRQPEPEDQVGPVNLALGSSDARRSRSPDDVPNPSSMSIGSRKYKAQQ
ncbi:hypothetical protein AAHN93_07870 [Vandammella animalimorsus]|uniref:hypothetical protein n=1 Tax=Vandammella animalimorsus TaxID=2029117 RepID=UPI0031BB8D39